MSGLQRCRIPEDVTILYEVKSYIYPLFHMVSFLVIIIIIIIIIIFGGPVWVAFLRLQVYTEPLNFYLAIYYSEFDRIRFTTAAFKMVIELFPTNTYARIGTPFSTASTVVLEWLQLRVLRSLSNRCLSPP